MNRKALTDQEVAAAARLAEAVAASGKSQEQIGAEVGVTQGQVWQWVAGRLPVPARRAMALAEAVGVADPGEISAAWRQATGGARADNEGPAAFVGVGKSADDSEGREVDVDFLPRARAKAGSGCINTEQQSSLKLKFRAESLKRQGIDPAAALVIYAEGDSMEPTITSGSTILFDTSRTEVKDGGIYVIDIDGHVCVSDYF